MARLRPGFDTISISGLEPLDPAAVQFERLSRSHGYSAHLAFSLAEAEHILDERR